MKLGLQATNIFFEGPKHAGVSRTSLRLLEAILEVKDHQYVIFVRHDSPIPGHWLDLDHVEVVRAWAKTRSWHYLGRDLEPIKHHLKAWFSVSGYVPRTPGVIKGSLVHDTFWRKYPETYTAADIEIHEKMAQNIARHSNFIAANSDTTANDFAQTFGVPIERFVTLPFGVGQATAPPNGPLPRPACLPDDRDYLFTISTLEPRKNLPRLFEAFAKLIQDPEFAHLNLIIAGAKGWKTEGIAERVAALGITDHVHFLGFVPDEEVPALFQHALLAITPSLDEGFGVPVLEAMTYGAVIASSDTPALREIGGPVPYYFDPKDEDSVTQILKQALQADDRSKRIEMARDRASGFSWSRSADILLKKIQSQLK